ncbi:hypothetical protein AvCA_22610 [Azotobacter vinelandii CA]|uniref:Uncharacterized protein n=2 Tax=Azotobacter vinelandii TaxID=354 RepID=C1DGE1_AZOVD|nr:hypothetical protein Avin_22610 [Azotobacter vinelandii DJ]AGK15005.1 hypothetical protein AvCA_22610 [Azotobacter vinelandii CA]AGK20518.1 hypothetical protein AvCA6_22610 [Azotobacter vinelandii CA6]
MGWKDPSMEHGAARGYRERRCPGPAPTGLGDTPGCWLPCRHFGFGLGLCHRLPLRRSHFVQRLSTIFFSRTVDNPEFPVLSGVLVIFLRTIENGLIFQTVMCWQEDSSQL